MPFEIICPQCDNAIKIREEYRDLALRCPKCGERIVPQPSEELPILLESSEPELLPILDDSQPDPPPLSPPLLLQAIDEPTPTNPTEEPIILESVTDEPLPQVSDRVANDPVPVFEPLAEPIRPPSFDVLLPKGWRSHRRFLMYYSPDELILIFLRNHDVDPEAFERSRRRLDDRRKKIERLPWAKLIEENRFNRKVILDEIVSAHLGPPSFWYRFKYRPRQLAGLLTLRSRSLGTVQIELMEERQVSILREMLPNTLGKRLQLDRSLVVRPNPLLS